MFNYDNSFMFNFMSPMAYMGNLGMFSFNLQYSFPQINMPLLCFDAFSNFGFQNNFNCFNFPSNSFYNCLPSYSFNFDNTSIFNNSGSPSPTKTTAANNVSSLSEAAIMDVRGIPINESTKKLRISTVNIPVGNGHTLKMLACSHTTFDQAKPEFLQLLPYLQQAAVKHGFTLVLSDLERSMDESRRGRAKKGNVVAPPGESPHNYGAAVDIVVYKNGKGIAPTSPEFRAFAEDALALSGNKLEWGGHWRKANESHHFEYRGWRNKWYTKDYANALRRRNSRTITETIV